MTFARRHRTDANEPMATLEIETDPTLSAELQ
jgi:hypothetical protein